MRTPPRLRLPRALAALIASALLVLGGALAAAPASAHDELVSTDPAAGAALAQLPEQLTLTFSGELLADEGATEVRVTDAAGTLLASGAPAVAGTVVTLPLDPAAAAGGAVTVLWRVVSSDGHPISGQLDFTVAAAAAPSPVQTPAPAATPTPPAAAETPLPSASADAAGDDMAVDAAATAAANILPVLIPVLLVVGVVAFVLVSRARRKAGQDR